ncbi:MAG: hypothetical protein A3F74_05110 [Betaproteobacteria bacterium RIFCSPLOWO2_12_FULL_62_58]|nr:MAG: hypothetical protein A3F74_05110 [Betaproteobacteria bacterium RIFCSPLOWO2_12_FULL_62_58]
MRETFVSVRRVEGGQNSKYRIGMRCGMRRLALACLVPVGMWFSVVAAQTAQWSPVSAVEIVVSTGVGGAQDRLARVMQGIIQNELTPVPVVVVNKPGGAGMIAGAYLNRSPSDGHSLLITSAVILANHIMGRSKFTYTDMTPVAQLFNEYPVLAVRSESPIKSPSDLLARLKESPDSVSIGLTTFGSVHHLSLTKAAKAAGINPRDLKIVVFKSGGEALTATMGGHVDATISSLSNFISPLEAGTIRALVISAPQRMPGVVANVPTWRDLGVDSVFSNFRIVFGPRGLSASQVAYWEQVLSKMVSLSAWTKEEQNNYWASAYLNSAQARQALVSEYASQKIILTDLGMAKQ